MRVQLNPKLTRKNASMKVSRALEKSLSGEFAFQCKFDRIDEVSKEALGLSEEFYKKVQLDCAEWIKLGTTKTAMVYGLGERGQLKNHE
jgi:hypothetical protein